MKYLKLLYILSLFLLSSNLFAEESGGLPQFDSSKFSQQIFWLIILFSIILIFLRYITIPKINTIKNTRSNKIIIKIEKSEQIKKKIFNIEKEMQELKDNLDKKEITLKQKFLKKITSLNEKKHKDFENYSSEKKKEFENDLDTFKKDIQEKKQEDIKVITDIILKKINVKIEN